MNPCILLLSLLLVGLHVSGATLQDLIYWETVMAGTPIPGALRHLLRPSAPGGGATACNSGFTKESISSSYSGLPMGSISSTYSGGNPAGVTATYSSLPKGSISSSYSGIPMGSISSSYSGGNPTGVTATYSSLPMGTLGSISSTYSGLPMGSISSSYSGVPVGSVSSTYSTGDSGGVTAKYAGLPFGSISSSYSAGDNTGGVTATYSGLPKGSLTSSYSGLPMGSVSSTYSTGDSGGVTATYAALPIGSVSSSYSTGDNSGRLTSTYSSGDRGSLTASYSSISKDSPSSGASEAHVHEDPQAAFFFLEKDLNLGTKMRLDFGEAAAAGAGFIPRRSAESIPFDPSKLPELLQKFSIASDSNTAVAMEQTLRDCTAPPVKGETKLCVTSLDSMVEFSKEMLGTHHMTALSTESSTGGGGWKEYAVAKVERLPGSSAVACHPEPYVYAVFNCHSTGTTRAYRVILEEEEQGAAVAVTAVAVCHEDTAGWNPLHMAFQVLKVKPGTLPVCHFLPQDTLVWAPKQ